MYAPFSDPTMQCGTFDRYKNCSRTITTHFNFIVPEGKLALKVQHIEIHEIDYKLSLPFYVSFSGYFASFSLPLIFFRPSFWFISVLHSVGQSVFVYNCPYTACCLPLCEYSTLQCCVYKPSLNLLNFYLHFPFYVYCYAPEHQGRFIVCENLHKSDSRC